jgi:hypothetical protein
MLIVQDWIDLGYKKFNSTFKEYADYGLQKLIKDEVGKKYFITVWVYENSKKGYFREGMQPTSFSPEVQFRLYKNDEELPTVNMDFILNSASTIKEIEDMIEWYWLYSGKPYYEVYYKD